MKSMLCNNQESQHVQPLVIRLSQHMRQAKPHRVKLKESDLKKLWGLSAGRCNKPDCRKALLMDPTEFDDSVVIGEQAHIAPHSAGGPRRISELPQDAREVYDNMILLCPNHHRQVDGQPNTYTEERLHQWKETHEAWVRDTLTQTMPQLPFKDLQAVAERLSKTEPEESTPLVDVDIRAKMEANGLTNDTKQCLVMAVAGAKEAQRYINYAEPTKPKLGRRLRSAFMAEYHRGVSNNLAGDDLFWRLYHFAVGPNTQDCKLMAAGIAILGYLFTTCEVFDAPGTS